MSFRRFAAMVLVAAVPLVGCGSGDSDTGAAAATVSGTEVAVGGAPLPSGGKGGIAGAIEIAAAAPGDASAVACTVDRQTLETAAEAYAALNSAAPTSQQDLLDAQMIRELSVRFEISADGAVVPAPGSPCT
jgi:hypothetical protein